MSCKHDYDKKAKENESNAFAEDVQRSLDAGMNGHLSKPIVMDEILKTIARNLHGKTG